jgi:hypothetical protein
MREADCKDERGPTNQLLKEHSHQIVASAFQGHFKKLSRTICPRTPLNIRPKVVVKPAPPVIESPVHRIAYPSILAYFIANLAGGLDAARRMTYIEPRDVRMEDVPLLVL